MGRALVDLRGGWTAPKMMSQLLKPPAVQRLCHPRLVQLACGLASGGNSQSWLTATTTRPRANELDGFLAIAAGLAILALLVLVALVFARVVIELKIEQRRRRRLVTTRDIGALSPTDFEAYVAVLFEKAGYHVRRTGGSGDHGVDLLAKRGGKTSIVQCKRYEDAIGPSTVRELIGAMTNLGIEHGFLVTTSDFTAGAQREAQKAPYKVSLIDGDGLIRWARTYGLPGELLD